MHVPDGFLDAPTSVATGVVAVAGVAIALRGARRELDDRTAPMAGLVATFVFAGQMMNFPVGAGTSGHLLGGALAAVLVGPWTAVLCLSVVLLVQALFMADGGITALGTNITLMALVGVGRRLAASSGSCSGSCRKRTTHGRPGRRGRRAASACPRPPLVFTRLFAVGGTAPVDTGTVLAAMLGWHVVIGLGEAVITGLVVGSVVAVRPDLVYGARGAAPRAPARDPRGGRRREVPDASSSSVSWSRLLLAGVASYYASEHPDGLEHVAEKTGFLDSAEDSPTSDSPLAGYSTEGVDDERLSGGVAGVVGVGLVLLARRRTVLGPAPAYARGRPHGPSARTSPRTARPDAVGAGHGHQLHFHGHSAVHRAPAHLKIVALLAFMLAGGRHARATGTPRSPATWPLLLVVVAASRVPVRLPREADGGRGPVRAVRGAGAVHRHRTPRSRCSG